MSITGVVFTVIIALLIGLLFYYVLKKTGPWGSFWTFFLIILLAGLAAIPWVEPIGPSYYNIAWVPITFIILIFAILLAAASPAYDRVSRRDSPPRPRADNEVGATAAALGVFFWILLVFFFLAIIAGFWAI